MGIQDRDYMRRDSTKSPTNGGIHPSIKNLQFQKNSYGYLQKVLFSLVVLIIGLSIFQNSVTCSFVKLSLDPNSDGIFNYKDLGFVINQIFYFPLLWMQSIQVFDYVFIFLAIYKNNCLSIGGILLSGLTWMGGGVLTIRLILYFQYIAKFVIHKILFDVLKISPFTNCNKILFRYFYPVKKFTFNPSLILFLFACLTVSQFWIMYGSNTSVVQTNFDKATVIKRNKQTDLVGSDKNYTNIYLNNFADLKKLDSRVQGVTSNDTQNIYTLSKALTEGLTTDLEKTYVIYKWVTNNIQYDTDAFFSNNLRGIGSASTVLQRRKAICDGYAEIIMRLGLQSNLLIEKVSGYSKGYGYKIGEVSSKPDHAWNAVRIDGNWYLMDATWDSGSISKEEKRFKKNDGDFVYFLTNPQIFLHSHLPEQDKWQLTNNTWTKSQFFSKVNVNEKAFKLGLNIDKYSNAILNADSLPYVIDFDSAVSLKGGLSLNDNQLSGEWVFAQYDINGRSKILVSAPSNGSYILDIFGDTAKRGNLFHGILSYKINVNNSLNNFNNFPLAYGHYSAHKVVLEYPLNGVLLSDQNIKFKLKANGAKKFVIYQNQKELEVMREQDGYFVADLKLGKGDAVIYGEFNVPNQLSGVLKYQVK